jgi:uncharacterized protein YukE
MQKFLECEQYAAECRQMAAQTKNPRYKKELEDMAEVWERLAHEPFSSLFDQDQRHAERKG